MASVRDDTHDMHPMMMDNPVFATGSSVNLFCPLCHEMFINPRLLPCLHTFCKRCLENLVVPRSSTLTCPACRTDVILKVRFVKKVSAVGGSRIMTRKISECFPTTDEIQ